MRISRSFISVTLVGLLVLTLVPAIAIAQNLSNSFPFSFPANGGVVVTPTPGQTLNTGYVQVQPSSGFQASAMSEILGFQSGGTLISETVFPTAPQISSGRLYVKLNALVSTGVIAVNAS